MRGGQADVGREIKHAEDWTSAVPPRTLSGVTKGWAQEILGRRDAPAPRVSVFVGLVALAMTCLHVFQTQSFWFPTGQFKNIHVNLAAILVFLTAAEATPDARHWARRAFVAMAFVAALPLVYIHVEYQALVEERSLFPDPSDRVVAIVMLAVLLAAAWREWGWIIPGMAIAGLLYGYFGAVFPGRLFFHAGIGLERLVGYTSIPAFSGLLGFLTEESARSIFMFMLFAGVLQATGGTDMIMRVAFALVGGWRAGPAQVAVVSSALFGMISGSTVANVAAQGPLTIPMMRRVGFTREHAGAIEAVSSTGGQITPPVLGLTAFLIVGITGIPYADVMLATIVPAALFYLYLMLSIHLRAIRMGIAGGGTPDTAGPSIGRDCLAHAHVIAGIALLFVCLSSDSIPAGSAALYPSVLMLAGEAAKRIHALRRTPIAALCSVLATCGQAARLGAISGAQIAIVVAVINVLVEMFVASGLGQRMSHMMLEVAGGALWPLLLMAALTCIVLGCGVPTSAAYILVALLGAPALVKLGVPLLAAHLFVFFYANVASITPPVALAALVAANISGGSYMRTSMICVALGLPCFILPFMFVIRPELIGIGGGLAEQAMMAVLAFLSLAAAVFVLEGHMLGPLRAIERMLIVPAAFALLFPTWSYVILAYAPLAAICVRQIAERRWTEPPHPPSPGGGGASGPGALGNWIARKATDRVTAD